MSVPFRSRNPVIIGAVSLAVITTLILATTFTPIKKRLEEVYAAIIAGTTSKRSPAMP